MIDAVQLLKSALEYIYRCPSTVSFSILPDWYFHSLVLQHAAHSPLTSLQLAMTSAREAKSISAARQSLREAERAIIKLKSVLLADTSATAHFAPYARVNNVTRWFTAGEQRIVMVWEGPARAAYISGNPFHFDQILEILLTNGIEAQGCDGVVVVKGNLVDRQLQLIIQDYGHGMSPSAAMLCQLVGYTHKTEGMGVGLACAYRLVRQFGGQLHMRSWQDVGTQFICHFPLDP